MELSREQMAALLQQAADGSQDAARQLTEHYGPHLRVAVRRWLHHRLRTQYDSVDFVQDVWASFFARGLNSEVFRHPAQLMKFLQLMARNKVVDAVRQRLHSTKANAKREHSLDEAKETHGQDPVDRTPTPSQIVSGDEQLEKLIESQPAIYREVIRRYMGGTTPLAICQELKVSPKLIQRALKRVFTKLRPAG